MNWDTSRMNLLPLPPRPPPLRSFSFCHSSFSLFHDDFSPDALLIGTNYQHLCFSPCLTGPRIRRERLDSIIRSFFSPFPLFFGTKKLLVYSSYFSCREGHNPFFWVILYYPFFDNIGSAVCSGVQRNGEDDMILVFSPSRMKKPPNHLLKN